MTGIEIPAAAIDAMCDEFGPWRLSAEEDTLWHPDDQGNKTTSTGRKRMKQSYEVDFDRIGRKHEVKPLTVEADTADELAAVIFRYARPHLMSADVDVVVDLEKGCGTIFAGFQTGGSFTITPKDAS